MFSKRYLVFVLFFMSLSGLAETENTFSFVKNNINLINTESISNDDWIKVKNHKQKPNLSLIQAEKSIFGDKIGIAWNISDFISVNFNIYENQTDPNFENVSNSNFFVANKSLNYSKSISPANDFSNSERISGYKFGVSSKLGLGRNYKLNIDFDYGLMDGADLVGFNASEVNTSSFALGIRKNKFGASLNTDIFIEDNIDTNTNSRLGFEFDWHFSDETTLSFGSKQRINNSTANNQSNSLESLTGDIQYIKFKHNL